MHLCELENLWNNVSKAKIECNTPVHGNYLSRHHITIFALSLRESTVPSLPFTEIPWLRGSGSSLSLPPIKTENNNNPENPEI